MKQTEDKAWRYGFRSLVEAALAHGAGQRREIKPRVPGVVIEVDFRQPREVRHAVQR